jgi:transcriptional regulator with XRE-family HTH domain
VPDNPWTNTPIGELRVHMGYSQKSLAVLLGWTGRQSHLRVSAIEQGREMPSDLILERLATILRVPRGRMRRLAYKTWRYGYLNRKNSERA